MTSPAPQVTDFTRDVLGRYICNGLDEERVWGLAWHGNVDFPGLAYCLGGRALSWGGSAPEPLDGEPSDWPTAVLDDLRQTYFDPRSSRRGATAPMTSSAASCTARCGRGSTTGSDRRFQLQLAGAGGGPSETNAEAQLFREIPDIDPLDTSRAPTRRRSSSRSAGTVRWTRTTAASRPARRGARRVRRAPRVRLVVPGPLDDEVWQAMRAASEQLAAVAAGGSTYDTIGA